MNITADTKLSGLLEEYPWLIDEAVKIDDRFAILNNPVGRLLIKNATVGDLSKKAGLSADMIINQIGEMIDQHEAQRG